MQQNIDAANTAEKWKKDHPDAKPEEVQKQDQIIADSRGQNDQFVDQKPDNPKIQLLGAQTSFDAHDPQKTLQRAANAEQLSQGDDKPLAAQAAYLAGRVHESEGDTKAALADLQRAHEYDPTNNDVNVALQLLMGHNLGTVAIKATKDPFSAHANGADSRLAGASNAPTSQAAAASGAVAGGTRPLSPELARLFKDAEGKLQLDPKAAEDLADKIIAADGSSANAYFLRGLARKQQERFAQAIEDFTKAIALGLRNALVYAARAAAYQAQKDYAKAEPDAREAARLEPRNGTRLLQLGEIQAQLGRGGEAAQTLDQAQELDPNLAQAARALEAKYGLTPPAPSAPRRGGGWLWLCCAAALACFGGGLALWRARRSGLTGRFAVKGAGERPATIDDTPTLERGPGPGDRVGQFELKAKVGRGGMGEVWEAWDHVLSRRVALKRIIVDRQLDERARELFIAEARAGARITHPNKPEVYGLYEGQPSRALWLAQEFVAGGTLADALDGGALDPRLCVSVAKGIGSVLDRFHGANIIHRDLKPSNILMDGQTPKVADFGIARVMRHQDATMTLQPAGTLAYMAPEQHDGVVSPQTDLFALGVTLYQALTGTLPFGGGDIEAKRAGRYAPATSRRAGLPAEVDLFFAQALNPTVSRRFQSGAELAQAFEAALREARPSAKDASPERPTTPA